MWKERLEKIRQYRELEDFSEERQRICRERLRRCAKIMHYNECNSDQNIYVDSQHSLAVGQRNVRFGKYNWRVLDVQNGKALLLTEDVIEQCCYHSSLERITWEGCELRGYLNGEFLQTFSSSEQNRIASVTNTNPDNPWYGTPGGGDTTDKVFLLSLDEVVKYFGDSGDLRARKDNGLRDHINDQYNEARMAKYGKTSNRFIPIGQAAWWWLRSPGGGVDKFAFAAVVDSDGWLLIDGGFVGDGGGVRPALWLNL